MNRPTPTYPAATQRVLSALDSLECEVSARLDRLLSLQIAQQARERRVARRLLVYALGAVCLAGVAVGTAL